MADDMTLESDALWQRLELEELRQALRQVHELLHRFEDSVKELPSCGACARAKLLEEIRAEADELGAEFVTIAVLADGLAKVSQTAVRIRADLSGRGETPCRCGGQPCTCHQNARPRGA